MPWSNQAAFGFVSFLLNPTLLPKATRALGESAGGLLWLKNELPSPDLQFTFPWANVGVCVIREKPLVK